MLELKASDLTDGAKSIIKHLKRPWSFTIRQSKILIGGQLIDTGDAEALRKGIEQLKQYELIEELPTISQGNYRYFVPSDMFLVLMSLNSELMQKR